MVNSSFQASSCLTLSGVRGKSHFTSKASQARLDSKSLQASSCQAPLFRQIRIPTMMSSSLKRGNASHGKQYGGFSEAQTAIQSDTYRSNWQVIANSFSRGSVFILILILGFLSTVDATQQQEQPLTLPIMEDSLGKNPFKKGDRVILNIQDILFNGIPRKFLEDGHRVEGLVKGTIAGKTKQDVNSPNYNYPIVILDKRANWKDADGNDHSSKKISVHWRSLKLCDNESASDSETVSVTPVDMRSEIREKKREQQQQRRLQRIRWEELRTHLESVKADASTVNDFQQCKQIKQIKQSIAELEAEIHVTVVSKAQQFAKYVESLNNLGKCKDSITFTNCGKDGIFQFPNSHYRPQESHQIKFLFILNKSTNSITVELSEFSESLTKGDLERLIALSVLYAEQEDEWVKDYEGVSSIKIHSSDFYKEKVFAKPQAMFSQMGFEVDTDYLTDVCKNYNVEEDAIEEFHRFLKNPADWVKDVNKGSTDTSLLGDFFLEYAEKAKKGEVCHWKPLRMMMDMEKDILSDNTVVKVIEKYEKLFANTPIRRKMATRQDISALVRKQTTVTKRLRDMLASLRDD